MPSIEKRQQRKRDGTLGSTTYRVRYRDPAGKSRSKTFKRQAQAAKFEATIKADLIRGEWHDPRLGRITFAEWVDNYMRDSDKRATTAARDWTVLRKHFLPALGQRRLDSITVLDVQHLVSEMKKHGLQPATVRTNFGVLKAVFSAAVQADLIPRSPCTGVRGVKSPSATRKQRKCLTAEQVAALAGAMPVDYRPMIYAGVLGLRWSEVAGLRVRHIDFLRRRMVVSETISEVDGRLQPADVKTESSRRELAVPSILLDMLAEHLAAMGRNNPDDYVFQAKSGGPVRYTNFRSRVWAPAIRATGLDGVTFHSLRHSAGGLMRQANVHTQLIQQRLGHASSRTTTDIYGWVPEDSDEAAAKALNDLIAESRGLNVSYEEEDQQPA